MKPKQEKLAEMTKIVNEAQSELDKKLDKLYPQLESGKFPGTEKPINRGVELVALIKAILSREPEKFTAALETWDSLTIPNELSQSK